MHVPGEFICSHWRGLPSRSNEGAGICPRGGGGPEGPAQFIHRFGRRAGGCGDSPEDRYGIVVAELPRRRNVTQIPGTLIAEKPRSPAVLPPARRSILCRMAPGPPQRRFVPPSRNPLVRCLAPYGCLRAIPRLRRRVGGRRDPHRRRPAQCLPRCPDASERRCGPRSSPNPAATRATRSRDEFSRAGITSRVALWYA